MSARNLLKRMRAAACLTALLAAASAGCAAAQSSPPLTPAQQAAADGGKPRYTAADVAFMQGMIHHHAQAIVMARLAVSNGASEVIRTLAERIDVSQKDEIDFMQG